jgi:cyclophilin family peptidyl-prolyl cis-trans isomerase
LKISSQRVRVSIAWVLFVLATLLVTIGRTTPAYGFSQEAPKIKYGDTISGEIAETERGRAQAYFFDGKAGEVVTVTMDRISGDLKPLMALGYLRSDGAAQTLAESTTSADGAKATISQIALTSTRTYFIVATREGGPRGTTLGKYNLNLTGTAPTSTEPASACVGVKDPVDVKVPTDGAQKQWRAPEQVIDPTHTYCAILTTDKGRIVIELFPKFAPKNVNSFVFLAQQGWYENLTWHRVIPDFVAQTGDPTGTGAGPGPGYTLPLEIDPSLKYDREGRIGMARKGNNKDSADSQFFITYGPLPSLDPHSKELPDNDGYTIVGQVVEGMDVALKIRARDPERDRLKGDPLVSIRVVDVTPKS